MTNHLAACIACMLVASKYAVVYIDDSFGVTQSYSHAPDAKVHIKTAAASLLCIYGLDCYKLFSVKLLLLFL